MEVKYVKWQTKPCLGKSCWRRIWYLRKKTGRIYSTIGLAVRRPPNVVYAQESIRMLDLWHYLHHRTTTNSHYTWRCRFLEARVRTT